MKRILLLLLVFISSSHVFSQKIALRTSRNGISLIETNEAKLDTKDDLYIKLSKLQDSSSHEYYLYFTTEKNNFLSFPAEAKCLLKTFDDKTIQLESFKTSIEQAGSNKWQPTTIYLVKEEELKELFLGVAKIRIEIMKIDKKTTTPSLTFTEKEYKKDKIGGLLEKMYNLITQEEEKIKKQSSTNGF